MMESPFFYLWITASLISSCYAYTWDIKLDWGLFDSKAGDNKFLREEIVYSSTVTVPLLPSYFTLMVCFSGFIILPSWKISFYDLDGHFRCL